MRVFCVTSDNYRHLMGGFTRLFNEFWGSDQVVTVLGYQAPQDPLPANFDFISLGKQEDFPPRSWCDGLIPYMERVRDDYFVVLLEDDFLIRPVDNGKLEQAECLIRDGASKVLLYSEPSYPQEEELICKGWNYWKQNGDYRTSLTPSIWKKDYFCSFLQSTYHAWDFEKLNMEKARNDGKTILLPTEGAAYSYFGAYRQGHFDHKQWQRVQRENGRFGPADWQVLDNEIALEVLRGYQ